MWIKGTREKLAFGIPMVWRERKDHCGVLLLFSEKKSGFKKKNKSKIEYPNLLSAIRPMPHSADTLNYLHTIIITVAISIVKTQ